jgi:hypothetical protein
MTLPLLKQTLESFQPTHMSDEDADNLELLLELPAFASLHALVEEKIEAYWDWLRANPRCKFEKPKAKVKQKAAPQPAPKQAPEGWDPNGPIIWFHKDPKSGLLTPVKY